MKSFVIVFYTKFQGGKVGLPEGSDLRMTGWFRDAIQLPAKSLKSSSSGLPLSFK
ncbi:hypothetical protein [Salipiger sp. CCB-MM3]|uniref:hypothetical protein n=1 Tax=Salipiger sp. CCB-MM3 TaxID=1792508 RepID=UPI0012FC9093|nr:hypothetical protein [Salipiger sp. CCB-MM3]